MVPGAAEVRLTPVDRRVLETRLRASTTQQRDVLRARIVLLADGGSPRVRSPGRSMSCRARSACGEGAMPAGAFSDPTGSIKCQSLVLTHFLAANRPPLRREMLTGLADLDDKPRPGPPPKYDVEAGKRVPAALDRPPPGGVRPLDQPADRLGARRCPRPAGQAVAAGAGARSGGS